MYCIQHLRTASEELNDAFLKTNLLPNMLPDTGGRQTADMTEAGALVTSYVRLTVRASSSSCCVM